MAHPKHFFVGGLLSLVLGVLLVSCATAPRNPEISETAQFIAVMNSLAQAWNDGNADRAVACFTEDAVYTEPPDKQIYRGRDALYRFFGGAAGRPGKMTMQWHHLAYNPDTNVGFGEFTFTYGSTVHGIAVVRVRAGRIANWREYWYESPLTWDQFSRSNPF
jgi:ketosteroid isomerase-like protein